MNTRKREKELSDILRLRSMEGRDTFLNRARSLYFSYKARLTLSLPYLRWATFDTETKCSLLVKSEARGVVGSVRGRGRETYEEMRERSSKI